MRYFIILLSLFLGFCKSNNEKIESKKILPTSIIKCYHFKIYFKVSNCDSIINQLKKDNLIVDYIDSNKLEFKYKGAFKINNKDSIYNYYFRPIDRDFTIYRHLNNNNNTILITNIHDEYPYDDIYIPINMIDSGACDILNNKQYIGNIISTPNPDLVKKYNLLNKDCSIK